MKPKELNLNVRKHVHCPGFCSTLLMQTLKFPGVGGTLVFVSSGRVTQISGQDMENSIFEAELATLVLVIFCFFIGMMSNSILITLAEAYTIKNNLRP